MRSLLSISVFALLLFAATPAEAQRAASPRGEASTQVGESFDQWVVVDYGRPILRGRSAIFGEGESYGEAVLAGAPVWRLGANRSTRLITDVALEIGGTTIPAGEHTLFVDFENGGWTLIVSNHKGRADYRSDEEGLWGAYNYSADMDVVRVPMNADTLPMSFDQFTMAFTDVDADGGTLAVMWENTLATVDFSVAE